jgi:hypothetical protein
MFYDIPAMTQLLEEMLNGHLEHGLDEWDAVCETLVALIGRFDAVGEDVATERMKLWLNEPALSARYMQYITHAEDVVTNCLRAHRGTSAAEDDLSAIVAAAAIGAYRVTIFTHYRARAGWKLAQHLRDALAVVGEGVRTALTRASATNHRTPRRTGSKIKA